MREARGDSIRLHPDLWPAAATEQEQRRIRDPFYEMLQPYLEHVMYSETGNHKDQIEVFNVKISSESVWEIVDLRGGQRTQDHNQRMGKAVRELKFDRANTAGTVAINGKNVMGYVKGKNPWP